ncbi:MAG TPA: 2-methylthioadenine synthetase, partial [Thermoplasmatales archaeon]|nr:2-methylthioadenine synthetase [Thermoplasmatales archaeon]
MRFYIETYGCTANRSDESVVKGILLSRGFELVYDPRVADVSIILTCTVIGTTEQRMLNRIRNLYRVSKDLIVSGCMASVQADLVKRV